MAIEITGRHVAVTDSMRAYAQKRLDKLVAEFPQLDRVRLILDVQKYLHTAEIVAHARRHIRREARAASEDMYTSIDAVVDKLETQLRRTLEKRHHHKGRTRPTEAAS